MLLELRVHNFLLIEELTIRLEPGFNGLTGETGAGKSIVVEALGCVLGKRASGDLVRPGSEEAEVEALFDVSGAPVARERLAEMGLDQGGELVLRRAVQASGQSRAYINGRLCTAAQLSELASNLVDISSQHESVALSDASTHLTYLDAFAKLERDRLDLATAVDALAELARELERLETAERSRGEREAFLRFQIAAIDEISPLPDESDQLAQERQKLRHAEKLGSLTRGAAERLYDRDGSLCDELGRIAAEVSQAQDLDPTIGGLGAKIDAARSELVDAARELSRYADTIDADPGRLETVEERLFQLGKLTRQHGGGIAEVLAARARMIQELDQLQGAEGRIQSCRQELDTQLGRTEKGARALSKARKAAAAELAEAIGRELHGLGMGRARVVVDVALQKQGSADFQIDGGRLTRDGIDRVEFLIAPNAGVEPRPLARIASGGELSRALLAIKRVLADTGPLGLYVFDEVDSGVGGAIAERIGRAIADVATHRQVLCITHLASIAAFAQAHFVVEKGEEDGVTRTVVRRLEARERLLELARMLAGARVTDAALRAAEELLAAARAHTAGPLAGPPAPVAQKLARARSSR